MDDRQIHERVLGYMRSKGAIPGDTEEAKLSFEYLTSGLIDSLGIVRMVVEFEREFGVHFEPAHMQSQDFQTVGGLIRLIQRLSRAAHGT